MRCQFYWHLIGLIMKIILLITFALLALGLYEKARHERNLKKVPIRILINGTRGKTTLTRLLVASLNAAGIKTIGRTTGSEAAVLHPDGRVESIIRHRSARVYEIIKFFKEAAGENAECAVVECMALQPENQKAFRDTLVKPGTVAIVNTFVDHVPEMGVTRESTSEVLRLSVPHNAELYVTEHYYDDFKHVHYVELNPSAEEINGIHPSAIAIASSILNDMGIAHTALEDGIRNFIPDKGLLNPFSAGCNSLFIPSFSINDLSCMDSAVKKWIKDGRELNLIYNNRKDREYRIGLFKRVLAENSKAIRKVYVIGDYKKKVSWHFGMIAECEAISIEALHNHIENSRDSLFVGLGNIKGEGESLIALFEKE